MNWYNSLSNRLHLAKHIHRIILDLELFQPGVILAIDVTDHRVAGYILAFPP